MAEERPQRRKKASPQVWSFYTVKGDSVTVNKRECPRCGKGVFLADHKDRLTCGKCGYTQFKKR